MGKNRNSTPKSNDNGVPMPRNRNNNDPQEANSEQPPAYFTEPRSRYSFDRPMPNRYAAPHSDSNYIPCVLFRPLVPEHDHRLWVPEFSHPTIVHPTGVVHYVPISMQAQYIPAEQQQLVAAYRNLQNAQNSEDAAAGAAAAVAAAVRAAAPGAAAAGVTAAGVGAVGVAAAGVAAAAPVVAKAPAARTAAPGAAAAGVANAAPVAAEAPAAPGAAAPGAAASGVAAAGAPAAGAPAAGAPAAGAMRQHGAVPYDGSDAAANGLQPNRRAGVVPNGASDVPNHAVPSRRLTQLNVIKALRSLNSLRVNDSDSAAPHNDEYEDSPAVPNTGKRSRSAKCNDKKSENDEAVGVSKFEKRCKSAGRKSAKSDNHDKDTALNVPNRSKSAVRNDDANCNKTANPSKSTAAGRIDAGVPNARKFSISSRRRDASSANNIPNAVPNAPKSEERNVPAAAFYPVNNFLPSTYKNYETNYIAPAIAYAANRLAQAAGIAPPFAAHHFAPAKFNPEGLRNCNVADVPHAAVSHDAVTHAPNRSAVPNASAAPNRSATSNRSAAAVSNDAASANYGPDAASIEPNDALEQQDNQKNEEIEIETFSIIWNENDD